MLFLLQVVAVFHFFLDAIWIGQQRHYLISVWFSVHFQHYYVSKIASQWVKDRELREIDCLIDTSVISNLNTDQQAFQVSVHTFVSLHLLFSKIFNHFLSVFDIFRHLFLQFGNNFSLLLLIQFFLVFLVSLVQSAIIFQDLCTFHLEVYCDYLEDYLNIVIKTCIFLTFFILFIVVFVYMGSKLFTVWDA